MFLAFKALLLHTSVLFAVFQISTLECYMNLTFASHISSSLVFFLESVSHIEQVDSVICSIEKLSHVLEL